MITKRISSSLSGHLDKAKDEIWYSVMPEYIKGIDSFEYIINRTLYRPRELIQFCKQIQDVSIDKSVDLPFDESSIIEAEGIYSKNRFDDIVAEYRFQHPGLDSVLETFRGSKLTLNKDELDLHCLKISLGELKVSELASWCNEIDIENLKDILWKIGFLKSKTTNQENNFVGVYEVRSLNIRNIEQFQIHNMFSSYLNCLEY